VIEIPSKFTGELTVSYTIKGVEAKVSDIITTKNLGTIEYKESLSDYEIIKAAQDANPLLKDVEGIKVTKKASVDDSKAQKATIEITRYKESVEVEYKTKKMPTLASLKLETKLGEFKLQQDQKVSQKDVTDRFMEKNATQVKGIEAKDIEVILADDNKSATVEIEHYNGEEKLSFTLAYEAAVDSIVSNKDLGEIELAKGQSQVTEAQVKAALREKNKSSLKNIKDEAIHVAFGDDKSAADVTIDGYSADTTIAHVTFKLKGLTTNVISAEKVLAPITVKVGAAVTEKQVQDAVFEANKEELTKVNLTVEQIKVELLKKDNKLTGEAKVTFVESTNYTGEVTVKYTTENAKIESVIKTKEVIVDTKDATDDQIKAKLIEANKDALGTDSKDVVVKTTDGTTTASVKGYEGTVTVKVIVKTQVSEVIDTNAKVEVEAAQPTEKQVAVAIFKANEAKLKDADLTDENLKVEFVKDDKGNNTKTVEVSIQNNAKFEGKVKITFTVKDSTNKDKDDSGKTTNPENPEQPNQPQQ
jgi:uncharacterized protein YqiB (DUF1249 family)